VISADRSSSPLSQSCTALALCRVAVEPRHKPHPLKGGGN
jgi:hypothetical protein